MNFELICLLLVSWSVNSRVTISINDPVLVQHYITDIENNVTNEWTALCNQQLSPSFLAENWRNYRSQLDGFRHQIASLLTQLKWYQLSKGFVWIKVLSKASVISQSLTPLSKLKQLNCVEEDKKLLRKILEEKLYPVYLVQQEMDQWIKQISIKLTTYQAMRLKRVYNQNATSLTKEMEHFSRKIYQLAADFEEVWSMLVSGAAMRGRHIPISFEWDIKGYAIYDRMLGNETDHYRVMLEKENQMTSQANNCTGYASLLTLLLIISTTYCLLSLYL